jgi:hypothetical protein
MEIKKRELGEFSFLALLNPGMNNLYRREISPLYKDFGCPTNQFHTSKTQGNRRLYKGLIIVKTAIPLRLLP